MTDTPNDIHLRKLIFLPLQISTANNILAKCVAFFAHSLIKAGISSGFEIDHKNGTNSGANLQIRLEDLESEKIRV